MISLKYVPHSYQEEAKDFIITNPAAGLFMDMGMGKSVTTLTAVDELMNDYMEINKVLVIAPKRVAEDTWSRETAKWDHTQHLKISKILGTEKQRLEALRDKADIYVINRENVEWLVNLLGLKWDFDMVVIDELSSFKNHQSKRFKALRKVRPFIKRIVGLTGTPAPNGYLDLWAEVYLLDRGERLEKTITAYRNKYFNTLVRPGFQLYTVRNGAREEINNQIKDVCISMKAKDYLKLKEPLLVNVPVVLEPKEMNKYRAMEKESLIEVEDTSISAINAAAATNKLLQLANGAVYDENRNVMEIHDKKLERLEELIEEANGNPVLVFYSFLHDKDRIKAYLKDEVRELDTAEDIKDWNDKKIKVLLAHPASAGHGLNLQDGGNIIVWFGLPWSLELYQQANKRLDRQGQVEGVIIHHLITEGTVDEDVLKVLQGKEQRQEELLEALKARIKNIGRI
jgi:SNF2 family DNA or RNA helicase